MPDTFHCTIVTPERQVLDEQVTYASIPAFDGQLGVAPQRAPLLAKLGDGQLRIDFATGGSRFFFLAGGFAQMHDNKLVLLSEEAIPVEEIVHEQAQKALQEALALHAVSDAEVQIKSRKLTRARALLALLEHPAPAK